MKLFVVCVLAAALFAENVYGLSDAHKKIIQDHMMAIAEECAKTITLTEAELSSLHGKNIPQTENEKCFVACMLKKSGIMDESGMLSQEGIMAVSAKVFADAPEELETMKEFLEACKDVNTAAVSDGAEGCDRAQIAMKCMKDNAAKFSLDL